MPSSTIFITGATGFIGSHVAQAALDAGYRVRLSVRKEEQIQSLKVLFGLERSAGIEFAVIPDISKPNAFKDHLEGVDHIFHLASPMPGKGNDFETEYLKPAVQGTEALLDAVKVSPSVKRVVVTSSILALIPLGQINSSDLHIREDHPYNLQVDPKMSFPEGAAGHGPKYHASKILAHQASVNWMKQHKPHFSLVTLHPSFVLGHSLIQTSASDISGINAIFWASLQRDDKPNIPPIFVDVRDVAAAHVRSIDVPVEHSGVREFILSGREATWEQVVTYIKAAYPEVHVAWKPPFGDVAKVNVGRAESSLGMKWKSVEEVIGSLASQQLQFLK